MIFRSFLLCLVCVLAGCSSTGQRFDASGLTQLIPGQSTYADAALAMGAAPTQVYRETGGAYTAWWMHKTSIVNDGLYARQSVALSFGPDNRLRRLVDSTNVLIEPWARTRLLGLSPVAAAPYAPALPASAVSDNSMIYIPGNNESTHTLAPQAFPISVPSAY